MIGKVNTPNANNSPKMERHQILDILGSALYNEAKTIAQGKIDNSVILPEKLKEIVRKPHNNGKPSQEDSQISTRIEF